MFAVTVYSFVICLIFGSPFILLRLASRSGFGVGPRPTLGAYVPFRGNLATMCLSSAGSVTYASIRNTAFPSRNIVPTFMKSSTTTIAASNIASGGFGLGTIFWLSEQEIGDRHGPMNQYRSNNISRMWFGSALVFATDDDVCAVSATGCGRKDVFCEHRGHVQLGAACGWSPLASLSVVCAMAMDLAAVWKSGSSQSGSGARQPKGEGKQAKRRRPSRPLPCRGLVHSLGPSPHRWLRRVRRLPTRRNGNRKKYE